jgi:type IV pilus assembly protein PilY1
VPDTYFYVVNPLKLEQQLTRAFVDILSRGVSHVAPAVSVDERNRIQSGDRLYMAFFKPISDNYWQGNVKKYGLDFRERSDCGRLDPEWTVVDQEGEIAGECDGLFKITSRSFWSSDIDGGYVDRGGVGERLLASMPGSDPVLPPTVGPYWDFRNIYTYKGDVQGAMVRFIHDEIDNNDLNVLNDYTRYRIINFMYGYTYDSRSSTDPEPKEKRTWILGDIIHSEPKLLDYVNSATGARWTTATLSWRQ